MRDPGFYGHVTVYDLAYNLSPTHRIRKVCSPRAYSGILGFTVVKYNIQLGKLSPDGDTEWWTKLTADWTPHYGHLVIRLPSECLFSMF